MGRFAWITGSSCTKPVYDVPVYETSDFVVLPSLGALVQGWLLVVPRRRMPNLSKLNDRERGELNANLPEIVGLLKNFEGDVFCFEHGGPTGSKISCGVDQAHLHIVPLQFDLFELAVRQTDVTWQRPAQFRGDWPHNAGGIEYLMIRANDGRAAVGKPKSETSQWFRRLIAKQVGSSDRWDYRSHPELPRINETVSLIGANHGPAI